MSFSHGILSPLLSTVSLLASKVTPGQNWGKKSGEQRESQAPCFCQCLAVWLWAGDSVDPGTWGAVHFGCYEAMCPVNDLSPHWNLVHIAQGEASRDPTMALLQLSLPACHWQLYLAKELSPLKVLCVLQGRPGADAGLGLSQSAGYRLRSPQPRAGPSRVLGGEGHLWGCGKSDRLCLL